MRYRDRIPRAERDGAGPVAWTLFRIWAGIGLRSFGGGASTQLLIWREFVEIRGWVGAEEMGRFWSLCLFTPGINLLALTILIGRKMGGARGLAASLAGLLLPSATMTCLLAAGFKVVQHSPLVHAVVRGIVPATAGIMGLVALNYARPIVERARKEGLPSLGLSSAIIAADALALILARLSVVAVLVGTALLGIVIFPRRTQAAEHSAAAQSHEDGSS